MVSLLVNHGVDEEATDEHTQDDNSLQTMRTARIEAVDARGNTPVLTAARSGHFEVVKTLISAEANARVRAANGETVLISAARWRNLGIVSDLFNL